jgi:hypothetical protein
LRNGPPLDPRECLVGSCRNRIGEPQSLSRLARGRKGRKRCQAISNGI